jgi:hypothetical protein
MSKKWINGTLTALVAFVFVGSAVGKFMADAEALKMAKSFGLDATTNYALGVLEIVAVLLFIFPRTGILGTLLLAAYMGGAIATHLEHGESILIPCVIQAVLWLVALYRFPELGTRLFKGKS